MKVLVVMIHGWEMLTPIYTPNEQRNKKTAENILWNAVLVN